MSSNSTSSLNTLRYQHARRLQHLPIISEQERKRKMILKESGMQDKFLQEIGVLDFQRLALALLPRVH
jgi:hypothetical protein